MQVDLHIGIDFLDGVASTVDFFTANISGAMENLPLKIGKIHRVKIDQTNPSNASGGEIEGDRGAETSCSDAEDAGGLEALLTLKCHFRHDEMAGVTRNLVIAEFDRSDACWIQNAIAHKKGVMVNLGVSPNQGKEIFSGWYMRHNLHLP